MSKKIEPNGQANLLSNSKQYNQNQVIAQLPIEQFSPPEYYCRVSRGLEKYLVESIETYGQLIPILVNENIDRQNVIIDGVARWEAMLALGYKKIKVVFTDVPKEQEKDIHIVSNVQCKEFYEDFIRAANGPLTEILLEYYAKKDREGKPVKDTLAEPLSANLLGDDEIRPLNIHLTLKDANWIKCMRKVLKKQNQSEVFQFLIKYFIENEKNKT